MEEHYYNPCQPKSENKKGGFLPHWNQEEKIQFVTFRLADSIPYEQAEKLRHKKLEFLMEHPEPWDQATQNLYWSYISPLQSRLLDNGYGSCVLRYAEIREVVAEAIRFQDGKKCEVFAFVIMPNHVHLVMRMYPLVKVAEVMHSIKSFSASKINKMTGRSGPLWMKEYFDRLIRNETHFRNCVGYIQANPAHLDEGEFELFVAEGLL